MPHIQIDNPHFQKTKKATLAHFKSMIECDDRWCCRALVRIYENQTDEEQVIYQVRERNGRGFNKIDANVMTAFAKRILNNQPLSERQMSLLHKRLPKYAEQLYNIAIETHKKE